jgi:hypothetical protein
VLQLLDLGATAPKTLQSRSNQRIGVFWAKNDCISVISVKNGLTESISTHFGEEIFLIFLP